MQKSAREAEREGAGRQGERGRKIKKRRERGRQAK